VIAREVLQLPAAERDPARFATVASQALFEPGDMVLRDGALAMTARW
jgi:tRNA 5-methylaminomethyl-2-thiouridine biosynthesis bifunctional protein